MYRKIYSYKHNKNLNIDSPDGAHIINGYLRQNGGGGNNKTKKTLSRPKQDQPLSPYLIKKTITTLEHFVCKIVQDNWRTFIKKKKKITHNYFSTITPFIDVQIAYAVVNKFYQKNQSPDKSLNKLTLKGLYTFLKAGTIRAIMADSNSVNFFCNEVLTLNALFVGGVNEPDNPKTINIIPLSIDDFIFTKKKGRHSFIQPAFGKTPTPTKLKTSPNNIHNIPESAALYPLMVGMMPYKPFFDELSLPRICSFPPFVIELVTDPSIYTQEVSYSQFLPTPGTEKIDCFARALLNMNVHLSTFYQSKLNNLVENYIKKLAKSSYGAAYTSTVIQLDLLNIYDSRYIYRAVTGMIENKVPYAQITNKSSKLFFTKSDISKPPHTLISLQKYQIWKMLFIFHSKTIKCFNKRDLNYITLVMLHNLDNGHVINFGFYREEFFIADIQADNFFSDRDLNILVSHLLSKYKNIDNIELLTRIPRTKTFAKKNLDIVKDKRVLIMIRPMVRKGTVTQAVLSYMKKAVIKLYVSRDITISELKVLVSNHPHILNLKTVVIMGVRTYEDTDKIKDVREYKDLVKNKASFMTLHAGIVKEPGSPRITVIPKLSDN